MKNQKLRMMFTQLKHNAETNIEVLSSTDELALVGGVASCPMLMTCGTYTSCNPKFKDGSGSTTTINLPDIKL